MKTASLLHGCNREQQLQDEVRHQLLVVLEISSHEDALVNCMRKSGILRSGKPKALADEQILCAGAR